MLPANVCPIVPMTLHKAGRRIEFVDVSTSTLCIDQDKLLERWTAPMEPPAGLIYVRTFGAIFDAAPLFAEIKQLAPEALIIDDRCACAPSFATDTLLENVDAVLYSTGYAKYVDIGSGGYAFVTNQSGYQSAKLRYDEFDLKLLASQYKQALSSRQKYVYADSAWLDFNDPETDWNEYREIVEIEANRVSAIKQAINHIYTSRLPPEIQLSPAFHTWRFNIHVADKRALLASIEKAGLFASGHYDALNRLFGDGSGENACLLNQHIINLFNDRYFDVEKAERLADLISNTKKLAPSVLSL